MPAVSVIIPMYNVRPYIEDCLLSLKRQTFGDFEALCVDDGSTDGTLEAARKAGGDDARFSFLSQANAGQSAARNAGIARATGKYVVFLDSDDYYEDRALQMLFERAERDGLDDLFFSARTLYDCLLYTSRSWLPSWCMRPSPDAPSSQRTPISAMWA